jgi:hypothetical protein
MDRNATEIVALTLRNKIEPAGLTLNSSVQCTVHSNSCPPGGTVSSIADTEVNGNCKTALRHNTRELDVQVTQYLFGALPLQTFCIL